MDKKPLYILTYEHGGYVLWKDHVKPRLKQLFKWLEEYPKLRIGLDYESFTFDEFEKEDPQVNELIAELLRKYPGRVGLGSTTYGQPLSLTVSEESNARQLLYAVRTNKKFYGTTPSVYSISEFALNNQTPQLIKLCGYEAALLRSHVMGYGYPKTFDSAWGRWIGKDKSEIPAVPTYDGQGRGYNCTTVDNWIFSRWPVDSDLYSPEDFEEMFSKYSPLLASRYDDLTQPIEKITEYTQSKDNYEYVLLEDIPGLFGKAEDELVTTDNDFHVQMPWGYCGNEIFNGCRKGEVEAVQAEQLNAFSAMLGGKVHQTECEQAWKYTLAAEHHDVTICGLLDLSRRFIPTSLEASAFVKKEALKDIGSRFANKEYSSLVAVNPQSFEVTTWLEAEVDEVFDVYDGETLLPCETTDKGEQKILRVYAALAPLSVKRFTLRPSSCDEQKISCCSWNERTGELLTPRYLLKLNDKGIVFIDDLKNQRRVVDNGDGELFTAYVDDEACASEGKWQVELSRHGAVAVQTGVTGSVGYRFEMRFSGDSERIECKSAFDLHGEKIGRTDITQGRPVPLTLNGHHHEDKLCFVMNVCLDKNRRMVRDLPYSISDWNGALRKTEEYWYPDDRILIDVEVPPEESFASTTYMHGIYWLCLRDDKQGLAVVNRGCMGSAIQGNRMLIPLIYSNEYMCGTRILEGTFENEFALLPFEACVTDAQLHRKALTYEYPTAVTVVGKGDSSMDGFNFATFDTGGGEVVLTTAYAENGYILLRFCNYSDEAATAVLKSGAGKVTAQTDLLGNDTAQVVNGELSFRPWEIKSIKIEYR